MYGLISNQLSVAMQCGNAASRMLWSVTYLIAIGVWRNGLASVALTPSKQRKRDKLPIHFATYYKSQAFNTYTLISSHNKTKLPMLHLIADFQKHLLHSGIMFLKPDRRWTHVH